MIEAVKRNSENIVRMVFFCACLWFCVKILGYDPNTLGLGGLIGLVTVWVGEVASHWINAEH